MKYRVILVLVCLAVVCGGLSAQELRRRPFLGVAVQPVPDSLRQSGAPATGGVAVQNVFENSSARTADIRPGDIITAVAGAVVQNTQQFLAQFGRVQTGDSVVITLYRDGTRMAKTVVMQPRPQEQYEGVEVTYGEVPSGTNVLRTILTRPRAVQGRVPVVYILQGVDCSSVDQPFSTDNTYARFVRYFSDRGFATFRVEKSGVGDSRGTPCTEMNFADETRGFLDGLNRLRTTEQIAPDSIYIVGLSMGGVWAPLLASQSEGVRGIVVYGTALRPWSEYMLENTRRQLLLAGEEYDAVETRTKELGRAIHYVFAEEQSPAAVAEAHPELAQAVAYLTHGSPPGRPEFIAGRHYTFMRQLYAVNISQHWKQVKADVLAVWGRGDFVSDPDDHRLIVDLVNNYRPGRATYAEINADHWFGTAGDMRESFRNAGTPKQVPFTGEILPLIGNWLQRIN